MREKIRVEYTTTEQKPRDILTFDKLLKDNSPTRIFDKGYWTKKYVKTQGDYINKVKDF